MRLRFVVAIHSSIALVAVPAFAEDRADADLSAAARVADRPQECGGGAGERVSRWERARFPGLGKYCEEMSRGVAALATDPARALAHAERALAAQPGRVAPLVLRARGRARLGQWNDAWAGFEAARRLAPGALESPGTLVDMARAASHAGKADEALLLHRALVPRLEWLADPADRERVVLEAALLAMSRGEPRLAEAAGYLAERRKWSGSPGLGDYASAIAALLADRQGRPAEATSLVAESGGPWRLEGDREDGVQKKRALPLDVPEGEMDALVAILAEGHDAALAVERWGAYVAGAASRPPAYVARARARLEALRRPGRGRK